MSDLDNLEHLANTADSGAIAIDAEARGPELDENGQPIVQQQAPDFAHEAAGAVDMFAALVVGFAPKAEGIWTQQAKARTAAALAPVMEKYGVTFGNLPPELTLAIVAGPLLWQSSRIVAEQINETKKAQPAPVPTRLPDAAPEQPRPLQNPQGPEIATHPQLGLYTAKAQP